MSNPVSAKVLEIVALVMHLRQQRLMAQALVDDLYSPLLAIRPVIFYKLTIYIYVQNIDTRFPCL